MLPTASKTPGLHRVAALTCLFLLSQPIAAQTSEAPTNARPSAAQQIAQHLRAGKSAYDGRRYEESLQHYSAALDLGDDSPTSAYNAACSASLAGRRGVAFGLLETAIGLGWVDAAHLARDKDLDALHDDGRWEKVVAKASAAERAIQRRWNSKAFQTRFADDLSASEKAAGLAKLWSEVKFNFVHFDQVPDLDWDQEFVDAMPKVLATTSTHAYYRELQRVVAKLNDGHTNVYLPRSLANSDCSPGVATRLVEGRVVVVGVFDKRLGKAGVRVGSEITKVDGLDVKAHAARNVAPFVCASTPHDRVRRLYGASLLRGPLDTPVRVTFRAEDGSEKQVEVRRQSKMAESFRRFAQPKLAYEVLNGNIGYLQLNSFSKQAVAKQFADTFAEIRKASALIIDLRKNGGGNSGVGWEILTHLVEEPFLTTRWHTLQYRPTMRAWGRQPMTPYTPQPRSFGRQKATVFDKPVVMLIGSQTFSAAEDMVAVFDQVARGKLIGEATGGSSGQPLSFDLPGGGKARVCTKHDFYADGSEFVGVGIAPDIEVQPTIADVRAGVDTVLQAAIAELKSGAR